MQFWDRRQAGQALAERLMGQRGNLIDPDPVVVGVARGGVLVAREVAAALGAPLDIALVGRIRRPDQPGTTLAAVAEGGVLVTAGHRGWVNPTRLRTQVSLMRAELAGRTAAFPRLFWRKPVSGRKVILVDDGVTTGATARAAARVLRARGAVGTVLAVPVASIEAMREVAAEVDHVVCLRRQPWPQAARNLYNELPPLSDEALAAALEERPVEAVPA
jgi:putative phosphoribosyl transferase